VRTLKNFEGTHILGASRGLLCDSSAVLCLYVSCLSRSISLSCLCHSCVHLFKLSTAVIKVYIKVINASLNQKQYS